jgi:hypothetical protein
MTYYYYEIKFAKKILKFIIHHFIKHDCLLRCQINIYYFIIKFYSFNFIHSHINLRNYNISSFITFYSFYIAVFSFRQNYLCFLCLLYFIIAKNYYI